MTQQNHIKYRPDIDGLRALAVLSVIVFHFKSSWLPGGFLGVDIFFVISGYLITSIIYRQVSNGRFTFRDFYTRRIKRILPLFFTVLLVTVIVAILLFDTRDFEGFWRTAKYAMQFRANRAFSGQGYFDPVSEEKPLLHLWSLAIEEQFYFIWPLSFYLIYKGVKSRENPQIWLFWIAIAGIILSLLYTEFRLLKEPGKAYFELSTRASELLVGCALALNPYTLSNRHKHLLGIVGIIILVACFAMYSEAIPFPGVTAMVPTIAAAFFIFDTNVNAPYKRIFTYTPVRLIGLWSFSLYLWHWPVLAFMRYVLNDTELPISWMIWGFILIVILSIFTYYVVENPIRKLKLNFKWSLLLVYLLPFGVMVSIHQLVITKPIGDYFNLNDSNELVDWVNAGQVCMDSPITESCYVGDLESTKRVLVIGDSHTGHLAGFMDTVGKHERFKAHMVAASGCGLPPSKALINVSQQQSSNTCLMINDYLLESFGDYDAVIISQYLAPKLYEPEEQSHNYQEKFKNTVNTISEGQNVYLIADIPALSIPSPARYLKLKKIGLEQYMLPKTHYSHEDANVYLRSLAEDDANVHFVEISDLIPTSGVLEGLPLYFDDNHLNFYGSKRVGELFIENRQLLKED
ncbi:acyltransferase [Ignatzschineria rhizosphaerae]|uniref:Acyltransferase n=1 Tax=Ignatzschineria rhizosphaerae TaxID=2923279 RepID=A0ABY3X850_9GAMM|nr:acyltransferase family protein [Ignatzschineria rhizosphaerae]UNM96183.1 acyltransferase [Ignatzschineria rhizosphaerae]